jgi:uncharacterized membrane protein
MKGKEVLISGITGTTFMTLFSYLVSIAENENFSEPERLGQLMHNLYPVLNKKEKLLAGWTAHYIVGLIFAATYVQLWEKKKLKPSFKNNLLIGCISGIVAVGVWKFTFKAHPLPPRLSFNKYYLQLVPAHIVFGIFSGLGYIALKNISNKITNTNNNKKEELIQAS